MKPFEQGEVVRVNPQFATDFLNGKMKQFSVSHGFIADLIKEESHIEFIVESLYRFKKHWIVEIHNSETGQVTEWQLDPEGRLHSALDQVPLFVGRSYCNDPNFCCCGGETIYKQLFTSTYPVCKACGKEKKQRG